MAGAPIDPVNRGIHLLLNELRRDVTCLETLWLSVITFGGEAEQVLPLTALSAIEDLPPLRTAGSTPMGAALTLLAMAIDTIDPKLVKSSSTALGDYRPMIFVFSGGLPTDECLAAADALRKRPLTIITFASAPNADLTMFRHISDQVYLLRDLTPEFVSSFFCWID